MCNILGSLMSAGLLSLRPAQTYVRKVSASRRMMTGVDLSANVLLVRSWLSGAGAKLLCRYAIGASIEQTDTLAHWPTLVWLPLCSQHAAHGLVYHRV